MRVHTIIKSSEYKDQRESNNRLQASKQTKSNTNNDNISFSEILKKVRQDANF